MITSFEVGAVFKIINQASPALTQILRQIREINIAVDKARKNLALITKPIGMGAAIGETKSRRPRHQPDQPAQRMAA